MAASTPPAATATARSAVPPPRRLPALHRQTAAAERRTGAEQGGVRGAEPGAAAAHSEPRHATSPSPPAIGRWCKCGAAALPCC
ncbi:hypothetical protein ACP4OV_026633 [Aristida adscensionis]